MNEGNGEGLFFGLLLSLTLVIGLGGLALGIIRKKKSATIIGGFFLAITVVFVAIVLLASVTEDKPSTTTLTAPVSSATPLDGVNGLAAVPPGFALVVEGESKEGSNVRRVHSVMIPELGVFRMDLEGRTEPAEMVITVRTPERELGYRGQAIFSGQPRPMDMAFLISPLTYPSSWTVAKATRTGNHISAVLTRGTPPAIEEYAIEADLDPQTGIIVSEHWANQYVSRSITRRLIPLSSIETPRLDEVVSFANADWRKAITAAAALPYPVLGVDLPFLQLHMLQYNDTDAWLDYSATNQPGLLAVKTRQLLRSQTQGVPYPTDWTPQASDTGAPGQTRIFVTGDRAVSVLVHDWVVKARPGILDKIEEALMPIGETAQGRAPEAPVIEFNEPMPLPNGVNFGELLPDTYRENAGPS